MVEENTIMDGEDYSNQKEYSFKEICMGQIQKVVTLTSKEMRKGFMVYSNAPNQQSQPLRYVGDSREELKRSIDALHDLLLPKFDEEIKDSAKKIQEDFDKIDEEVFNKVISPEERRKYWRSTLKLYRQLFQELCLFLERMGWLEGGEASE